MLERSKKLNSNLPPLVVILGPTASGKSSLAIKLAKQFHGEIINADSRTVYTDMHIGTACPEWDTTSKQDLKISNTIPHHLFQTIHPNEEYSVQMYKQSVVATVFDIYHRKNIPFLVGGTGLYIQSIVDNFEIPRVAPQPALRKRLEKRLTQEGLEPLWKELLTHDPKAKNIIDQHNPRRVIRALEIVLSTNAPLASIRRKGEPFFNTLQLGVMIDRDKLYKRIDQRTDEMFRHGLLDEVQQLILSYGKKPAPFHGLVYQQCLDYLEHNITLPEAVQKAKFAQHAYARRQMTWFKRDKRIIWIKNKLEAKRAIKNFLKTKN